MPCALKQTTVCFWSSVSSSLEKGWEIIIWCRRRSRAGGPETARAISSHLKGRFLSTAEPTRPSGSQTPKSTFGGAGVGWDTRGHLDAACPQLTPLSLLSASILATLAPPQQLRCPVPIAPHTPSRFARPVFGVKALSPNTAFRQLHTRHELF